MGDPRAARLVLHPTESQGATTRFAASLIEADGSEQRLWWEVPSDHSQAVTNWADPWLIGLIFPIMQRRRSVRIEGSVSPSLLAGIDLFMRVWSKWVPERYHPVGLSADEEAEPPPAQHTGTAVTSFSCGLDSCFTVYRHVKDLVGRRTQRIGLAVIQHGFDVTLDQENSSGIFENLLSDASTMLGSLDAPCIPIRTNFRRLDLHWADALGSQLVSGLSLFARGYDRALIANDLRYYELGIFPWGAHPLTTPMLGSVGFPIIDDGVENDRVEKAQLVSAWPEAMRHLRVCFGVDVPGSHANCGHCEKCIRTMLAFRIAGSPRPTSFAADASDALIKRIRLEPSTRPTWQLLSQQADLRGMGQTSWAKAIQSVLRQDARRTWRNKAYKPFLPIRSAARRLTRGADISRAQIKQRAKSAAAGDIKPN